jgi:ubiquinone/menaquinone biosynthesis C-methylase UbiE
MQDSSFYKSSEVKSWDRYWGGDVLRGRRFLYNLAASFYRRFLIKPSLNHFVKKYFKKRSQILHAGCGGGEVDDNIRNFVSITALDFSQKALEKYKRKNRTNKLICGDIRSIPLKTSSFDGIYNLGVMEHFNLNDIKKILKEFHRVLKPGGYLIIFWPPEFGISVIFFKALVYVYKKILNKKKAVFHPTEIFRLKSEGEARRIFKDEGFRVIEYYFGMRDLFTYSVIVAQK